ncbi:hypothetical protein TUM19329_11320 [Legionella antarctica]|uniref:Protein kinase domain-containing protein n=1 Tax=Legionella antarctica TaxID=2708020 RepID=A0A6F8T2S6_9GAMM|nr:hypothetical protein [Legionella antarctica]BCA94771.1 hypothetical protein TUM19329_11320 [Legionella antarctica]
MPLQLPAQQYCISKDLLDLIKTFNKLPEEDHIQRLFYLQKINYLLNTLTLSPSLFAWLADSKPDGWLANLNAYEINADASIFVKGLQFAQAIANLAKVEPEQAKVKDEFQLMQERDALLRNNKPFEEVRDNYIAINSQLHTLSESDHRVNEIVRRHSEILDGAKAKLDAIQKRETPPPGVPVPKYKTKVLGTQINNYNFEFTMEGWEEFFVFRVEDRDKLGLEQDLHSFPMAKYFIEDYAVFMMRFKSKTSLIEYRPVVLSQFANGGNLADVAKKLRKVDDKHIGSKTAHYFSQLADFCTRLMDSKTYHPDIKLTNFLVHRNLIRISDRKTFLTEENPTVSKIRSSPPYAPEQFTDCLNEDWDGYNQAASKTVLNMPQFMAYQLGMALKEFLILTQMDEIPDLDAFRDHDFNPAHYFTTTPRPIVNLSVLIQELTRPDPDKRMSIQQFKELMKFLNHQPEQFYQKVEEKLPSSTIGFQEDIDAIQNLLDGTFPVNQFLQAANPIFNKLSDSPSVEPRLIRMAEKLATKCFEHYAKSFFNQCIETALLNKDWDVAPWYRQLIHVLSFGYFRVEKVTELSEIRDSMGLDLNEEQFLSYFPHLEFLPPSKFDDLGNPKAEYLKEAIKNNVALILSDEGQTSKSSSESIAKTMPLNGTSKDSKKSYAASLSKSDVKPSLDSPSTESSAKNSSISYGTMVIDENAKSLSPGRLSFFAANDTDHPKPKPANKKEAYHSVTTSMLQGDNFSYRGKKPVPSKRTNVNKIVWEPPTDPVPSHSSNP